MPCGIPMLRGIPCCAGYRAAWDTVPRGIPCRAGYHAARPTRWRIIPYGGAYGRLSGPVSRERSGEATLDAISTCLKPRHARACRFGPAVQSHIHAYALWGRRGSGPEQRQAPHGAAGHSIAARHGAALSGTAADAARHRTAGHGRAGHRVSPALISRPGPVQNSGSSSSSAW
jgi:hypothetical protein